LPNPLRRRVLRIWEISETERRELVEPLVRAHAGEYARQALTIDEVHLLARTRLVSFGSHTVRHPSLTQCDVGQLEEELRGSKDSIESWTGRPVNSLAYPRNHFDGRERDALALGGYELAVTVEERVYRPGLDDAYYVPRLVVGEDSFFSANVCKMVAAWKPYINWARRIPSSVRG
jgi:peptidoglycan/xylan/chitin deacetylase (PgdA/CDA1 family)